MCKCSQRLVGEIGEQAIDPRLVDKFMQQAVEAIYALGECITAKRVGVYQQALVLGESP